MKPVYTIHAPEADHLEAVKAQMQTLGSPEIRVVDCGDYYMALEGCHRIAAAHALGLDPEFIVIDQDDELNIVEFDWFEACNWDDEILLAGVVAGELFSDQAKFYRF